MEIKPILTFAARLSRHQVLTICLATLALICPGIWTLWLFDPNFLALATTPKLLVIASSISAPILLVNTIASHLGTMAAVEKASTNVDKTRVLLYATSRASISTMAALGAATLVCAILGWSLKGFLIFTVAYELLLGAQAYRAASNEILPGFLAAETIERPSPTSTDARS